MSRMPRKWSRQSASNAIRTPDGGNIFIQQASETTLARLTASLNFTDDMKLDRLETAPDTAKSLLSEAFGLLDAYLSEIDYQLSDDSHDADALAFWQADQERVMAFMRKIEPLTGYVWLTRGDEGLDEE